MSIANLLNIPNKEDVHSFDFFSFSNMDQHRIVTEAILAKHNVGIELYPLDPIPFFALPDWLRLHQQSHNAINGVLGVDGVDLTSVDFQDEAEIGAWLRLHENEHVQWAERLGLA
jgi:hypothetical protein